MKKYWFLTILCCWACEDSVKDNTPTESPTRERVIAPEYGGAGMNFKVPIQPGFNWELSQSWAQHCSLCEARYSDWNYCQLSHSASCCDYGYDFNLPGSADLGKAVLASDDGQVRERGFNSGWGNYILIDHGQGICTRYAHMLDESTDHISLGQQVCQGLKIGEIGNTGASNGSHLHFQFEECDSGDGLPMGFNDGNGTPICTRGEDVFDQDGNYNFLTLTNTPRSSCKDISSPVADEADLPEGGWLRASCGTLPGCPLLANCGRGSNHEFSDQHLLSPHLGMAANYLWSECALDGKADGGVHQYDLITRAETLKIALYLFGLMEGCGISVPFEDVEPESWYYPIIACAVRHRLVNTAAALFNPNHEVNFAEAAKLVVGSAVMAGVIDLQEPAVGHFRHFPREHWAYGYVETLYVYGGIVKSPDQINPTDAVQRREVIMMAASLSPCYCANVVCESSCRCEQSLFACVDPRDNDPGLGGQEPDASAPQRRDLDAATPPPVRQQPDANIPPEEPPPPPVEEPPLIEEIPPPPPDAAPPPPPRQQPDANIPPEEPPPPPVEEPPLAEQDPEPCIGYRLGVHAPGGWVEARSSGPNADYYRRAFLDEGDSWRLNFNCDELPGVVLLHAAPGRGTRVWTYDGFPSFQAWAGYDGPLTFNPPGEPDFISRNLSGAGGPGQLSNILVLISP